MAACLRAVCVELGSSRFRQRLAPRAVREKRTPSVHPLGGIELRSLRRLLREQPESRHVFLTERRSLISAAGFRKMLMRTGGSVFLHPHMLRHACGYKLANDGHDTRALQHNLSHKKISSIRFANTELSGAV
jgi:integrase